MTMLNRLLRPKAQLDRVRFRAMMESGRLVDEVADVVQTQVIAHKARASIRNRDAVGRYLQREEGRPPVWEEHILVETGYATPPGFDSRYILEDSHNLWLGYKTGTVDSSGLMLEGKHIGLIALGVSVLIFFLCAWLAQTNLNAAAEAKVQNAAGAQAGQDQGPDVGFVTEPATPAESSASPADILVVDEAADGLTVPAGGGAASGDAPGSRDIGSLLDDCIERAGYPADVAVDAQEEWREKALNGTTMDQYLVGVDLGCWE